MSDDGTSYETEPATSLERRVRTRRWWPAEFAALGLFAFGLLTFRPELLALAAVGIAFATYAATAVGSDGGDLELTRSVDPVEPYPGQTVEVTLTVRNAGDRRVHDLRLVDGVPGALEVRSGSPRFAAALSPREAYTHTYELTAARGEHTFEPATAAVNSLGGAWEQQLTLTHQTTLTCSPPPSEVPLGSQTSIFTGRLSTDVGGTGLEFHSVREHRSGDPLKRIDWRRYARTRELATVNFREERAATVVLVVDTRPAAYWTRDDERHAVARAVAAAGQIFGTLVSNGDRVGLTVVGDGDVWFPPSGGQAALTAGREVLATNQAFQYDPPDVRPEPVITPEQDAVNPATLLSRLPPDAQVVAFTPLCDDGIVDALKRLEISGHVTTVVSPDVTREDTVGRRLARTQRANRLWTLREAGVRVLDWGPSTSLRAELTAENRRRKRA